jgi:hypothetical protein
MIFTKLFNKHREGTEETDIHDGLHIIADDISESPIVE